MKILHKEIKMLINIKKYAFTYLNINDGSLQSV